MQDINLVAIVAIGQQFVWASFGLACLLGVGMVQASGSSSKTPICLGAENLAASGGPVVMVFSTGQERRSIRARALFALRLQVWRLGRSI